MELILIISIPIVYYMGYTDGKKRGWCDACHKFNSERLVNKGE